MEVANTDGAYGYVDIKQITDAPTIDAVPVAWCNERRVCSMCTPITCKIYDGNTLLHDLMLCKDKDGNIGWYDFVDDTFHDQTVEILIMLKHSMEMEVVEYSDTQYIDTGVVPKRVI